MAPEFEDDLPELAEVGFAALATLGSDGCPWLADLSVPVVTEYALSEFVVAVPDFEDDFAALVVLAHVHELHLFAEFVCVEYFQFLFLHFSWSENSEDDRLQ